MTIVIICEDGGSRPPRSTTNTLPFGSGKPVEPKGVLQADVFLWACFWDSTANEGIVGDNGLDAL